MQTFSDNSAPLNRRQRRMLAAAERSPIARARLIEAAGHTDTARLSKAAFERLKRNLESFGNVLSDKHKAALMRMVGGFSALAARKNTGRYAFALDTGCGKTQSVVAWCAALHELGLPYSVAIAASKVEALCQLKRDLIANGVPEDKIGLWHSYAYSPEKAEEARLSRAPNHASEPATTNHDGKQILLLTHSRIRGASGLDQLNRYRGKDRDLIIWDESLLVSDHRAIARLDLQSDLGWLGPQLQGLSDRNQNKEDRQEAYAYLTDCMAVLESELAAQESEGRAPRPVRMPERSVADIDRYMRALAIYRRCSTLSALLEFSQQPLRVVRSTQGGGAYVAYDVVVPPELQRIAVLDASWPIRALEQLDDSIDTMPAFDGRVKRYSRVTVHFLKHGSGRATTEQSFRQARYEDRRISREIAEVVNSIPGNEAMIVFTFKPHGPDLDIEAVLRRDLEAAGIDPRKTIKVRGNDKPRLVFLRWGQETSLSEFSYCSNVIFAGVLHRSDADLAGAIIGQKDNLLAAVTPADIQTVKTSEVVHALYQAMSRGSCREIENGEAKPMKAWLSHHDSGIKSLLDRAMPGLQWKKWQTKHLAALPSKIEDAAGKIVAYLEGLPQGVLKVSMKALKKAAGLDAIPETTLRSARDAALGLVPWTVQGRSFVRLFPAG